MKLLNFAYKDATDMRRMRTEKQQKNCPSCGAPVVSEICAYCGNATGLHTAGADMEYPVLDCKEATVNFWTICFPLIFAVAFGLTGLIMLLIAGSGYGNAVLLLVGAPFFLIGAAALFLVLRTVSRYVKVTKHGKRIRATVYGYMNDDVLINNQPAQVVKLLVQTANGPRFILYQLGNTLKPYGINDSIDIMVYQNVFLICKNKEAVQW